MLLALILQACGGSEGTGDDQEAELPQIQIVNPLDTVELADSIAVRIVYSDNTGLIFTEVTLGTQSGGNTVYHSSQRGLAGLSDELEFKALVPSVIDIRGTNYILVKCRDEDGNEQIKEKTFLVRALDVTPPQIIDTNITGVLTTDPNVVFEVSYNLSDNQGLNLLEVDLLDWTSGTQGAIMKSTSKNLEGSLNAQGFIPIHGNPSFSSVQKFRVRFRVTDNAGNLTEAFFPRVFEVY